MYIYIYVYVLYIYIYVYKISLCLCTACVLSPMYCLSNYPPVLPSPALSHPASPRIALAWPGLVWPGLAWHVLMRGAALRPGRPCDAAPRRRDTALNSKANLKTNFAFPQIMIEID